MSDWDTYFKKHAVREPRSQLIRAISFCTSKKEALDLGAGTLVESNALLQNGFEHVRAVDSSPESLKFSEHFDSKKLSVEIKNFSEFIFPNNFYDLVNAQYALPFYGKEGFEKFIDDIKSSLKQGGIFVGQFFGVNDEWNTPERKLSFQTKEEVERLLSGLDIVEFSEEEKDGTTAAGSTKHWHVFHFIARKK